MDRSLDELQAHFFEQTEVESTASLEMPVWDEIEKHVEDYYRTFVVRHWESAEFSQATMPESIKIKMKEAIEREKAFYDLLLGAKEQIEHYVQTAEHPQVFLDLDETLVGTIGENPKSYYLRPTGEIFIRSLMEMKENIRLVQFTAGSSLQKRQEDGRLLPLSDPELLDVLSREPAWDRTTNEAEINRLFQQLSDDEIDQIDNHLEAIPKNCPVPFRNIYNETIGREKFLRLLLMEKRIKRDEGGAESLPLIIDDMTTHYFYRGPKVDPEELDRQVQHNASQFCQSTILTFPTQAKAHTF